MSIDLVIIGGTGLYAMPGLVDVERTSVPTPWGRTSDRIVIGSLCGRRIAFLARHGEAHTIAPHQVNYRANLWALREIGSRAVIGVNAVGGISARMAPQVLALPDQLIDYTWGREASFDAEGPVQHVEFAEPYAAGLRQSMLAAASRAGIALIDGGCYGVTQGPRLETRAEIGRLRRDQCDLVGMTGMPEAILARQLNLPYACLALVANWAAGCGSDCGAAGPPISMQEVAANVAAASSAIPKLLENLQLKE